MAPRRAGTSARSSPPCAAATLAVTPRVIGRIPVYDYSRELPPPPPTFQSTHATWTDVRRALAGVYVVGMLFIAVFLWMALAAPK